MATRRPSQLDLLQEPRVGGLYHGVSRQAPLQRAAAQLEELDNFMPSVDLGGIVDRSGTTYVAAASDMQYQSSGSHFFRTTDGQRWNVTKRIENGQLEVRNADSGHIAALTYGPFVQNYIGSSLNLKFLTISDTTLILNPNVVTTATIAAKPELSQCYVVIRKASSANQFYNVTSAVGTATFNAPANNGFSRDYIATQLAGLIAANMPGIVAYRVTGNTIRLTGSAANIASVMANNDWDESAVLLIKGRVSATGDLPGVFENGQPVLVDLNMGEGTTAYYVRYDTSRNAYFECSYLPHSQATGSLDPGSMPIRLHQTSANAFELQPVDWTPRKVGDGDSNGAPDFIGKAISAMALWKGRLWLAAEDAVTSSQPDDFFHFWRSSARQVSPSDPVFLRCSAPDLGNIQHLVAFSDKLMVFSDTAQMFVDGSQPVTPTDSSMDVSTRYQAEKSCTPEVVGDSLYFSGTANKRSALWEFKYAQESQNNVGNDLSKHIPGYIPGRVTKLAGAAQAGRVFCWTPGDPGRLYVNSGYVQEGQRKQNAWNKLTFPQVTTIQDFWVHEDTLFIVARGQGHLWFFKLPVDVDLGDTARLDVSARTQVYWNVIRNRSEVMLPPGYSQLTAGSLWLMTDDGVEVPLTVVHDGTQWLAYTPTQLPTFATLGIRYDRYLTFSPFYARPDGEKATSMGRFQVHNVLVDALVSCDHKATVTRPDRVPMVVARSPRVVGNTLVPDRGDNETYPIPFNSEGHKAQLTISTNSTAALAFSGYTLQGRYTNAKTS